jgi:hypothetical protein
MGPRHEKATAECATLREGCHVRKIDYDHRRQALIERYPYMFAGCTVGIQSSPCAERLAYAIDIEPGWLDLIEKLCADIDGVVPATFKRDDGKGFHIRQIKEKFGTLRFYWDVSIGPHEPIRVDICSTSGGLISLQTPRTDRDQWRAEVNELIAIAEQRSAETCVFCGAPGRLRRNGKWLYTSCDAHDSVRERFDP